MKRFRAGFSESHNKLRAWFFFQSNKNIMKNQVVSVLVSFICQQALGFITRESGYATSMMDTLNKPQTEPLMIITFYRFHQGHWNRDELPMVQQDLQAKGRELELSGLLLIATEGVNGTICGTKENLNTFIEVLRLTIDLPQEEIKTSYAKKHPFKRFKVDIREELITFPSGNAWPEAEVTGQHLSPQEWRDMIINEEAVVIDARNNYETRIGRFKNALVPNIDTFDQFTEFIDQAELPKNKPMLLYCTGGIKCEKASLAMEQRGFEKVYQLHGGILNYLEQQPGDDLWEGECFVYDHRVAVDNHLQPSSQYEMCPFCGNPGEVQITCRNCDKPKKISPDCYDNDEHFCSKNCRNEFLRLGVSRAERKK